MSAADWTMERAVQALRGPIGTPIELAVRREGVEAPIRHRLTRERIHQRAVSEGVLLPDGVGYLSLSMVRENCAAELEQEVARLMGQGMKSLLLDLRSDPGGLRDEAVQAADLFLDPRQEILVSRGRAPGDNHRWSDGAPQRWRGLPIVVLVNRGTASAAEIIAGALQDHDRALVVGDTTYGKGIVQTLFPLGTDVALRITTARWYTPSGRSIQGASLDSVMGAAHAAADSAAYRSDGGRPLAGGGGIVPDVLLDPDTLTTRGAGVHPGAGRQAARRSATCSPPTRWSCGGAARCASEGFEVESGDAGRGAAAAGGAGRADGGQHVPGRERGSWTSSWATRWRATGSGRRRSAGGGSTDDPQIGQAVALLRQAATPSALLGLAGAARRPGSLIDDADAGRHVEREGAVRHRLVDPHLRQRQRPRRARVLGDLEPARQPIRPIQPHHRALERQVRHGRHQLDHVHRPARPARPPARYDAV